MRIVCPFAHLWQVLTLNFAAAEFFRFFDCITGVHQEATEKQNNNKNSNKNNNNNNDNETNPNPENESKAESETTEGDKDVSAVRLIPTHVKERLTTTATTFIDNKKEGSDWPPRLGDQNEEPISVAASLIVAEKRRNLKEKLRKISEVEILHRIHTFDLTGMYMSGCMLYVHIRLHAVRTCQAKCCTNMSG